MAIKCFGRLYLEYIARLDDGGYDAVIDVEWFMGQRRGGMPLYVW